MATKREIQKTLKAIVAQREVNIAAFRNRLDRFLSNNLDEILGELETGNPSVLDTARILGNLRTELVNAGLDDELGQLFAIYDDELNSIDEIYQLTTNRNITYSNIDAEVIDTLINFDIERTRGEVFQYAEEIKSVILRSVLTGIPPNIRELHNEMSGAYLNSIETELVTSVSGFNQTINNNKAKEAGLELFLYVGPDDDATRPFCEDVLHSRNPPIYTSDEISQLDNGQGLDVDVYRGGYNCRHQWSALTLEVARDLGYGEN